MPLPSLARGQSIASSQVTQPQAWSVPLNTVASNLPPPVMVLLSIVSVQLGATLAKALLATQSPFSIVLLRAGFAAVVLWLIAPPQLRGISKRQLGCAALLGVVITILSLSFYEAVTRIPLGITMTIEFLGPLAVAVAASRRTKDLIWPILALAGIFLLAPTGNLKSLSLIGIAFAFLAAVAWAAYLVLAKQTTAMFSGITGLTLAMTFAAIVVLPFGLFGAGTSSFDFSLLINGFWISTLSTIAPLSLEFLALKRMSQRTFGILISGEPSVAAVLGLLMLHEHLTLRAWAALALVSIASVGVTCQEAKSRPGGSF